MIATALGSFAGRDLAGVARALLELLPERAPIPELPARGPAAGIIARSASMLPGINIDLQPAGWRLALGPSLVQRRAASQFNDDVSTMAELAADWPGVLTLTIAGPFTLLASLDQFRGGKVIGDPGARHDIVQAWSAGLMERVAHARRQLGRTIAVQIDEPSLVAVLEGTVPSESGRTSLPPVNGHELSEALGECVATARVAGGNIVVMHCCAGRPPVEIMAAGAPDALSIDTAMLETPSAGAGVGKRADLVERPSPVGHSGAAGYGSAPWDVLAEWFDDGHDLWLGILPTDQPTMGTDGLRGRLMAARRALEAEPGAATDDHLVLTPACGLAGVAPADALSGLRDLVSLAGDAK